jgi:hypothetical protein
MPTRAQIEQEITTVVGQVQAACNGGGATCQARADQKVACLVGLSSAAMMVQ